MHLYVGIIYALVPLLTLNISLNCFVNAVQNCDFSCITKVVLIHEICFRDILSDSNTDLTYSTRIYMHRFLMESISSQEMTHTMQHVHIYPTKKATYQQRDPSTD